MAGWLALNLGTNQYTSPIYSAKKCFIVAAVAGNIPTTVKKGRPAGPMRSLLLLHVYGRDITQSFKIVVGKGDIDR